MTLAEAKDKAYTLYTSRMGMMRDLIEDPKQLSSCGYKTLEQALTSLVKSTVKEVDAVFKKYESDNPS